MKNKAKHTSLSYLNSMVNLSGLKALLILSIGIWLAACNDDEKDQLLITKSSVVEQILGESSSSVETIRYRSQGEFYEPHQDGQEMEAHEEISATFDYTVTQSLTSSQLNYNWNQEFIYPFAYSGTSEVRIDGNQGSIEGAHGLGSKFFGFSSPTPIYSSRLEAIKKTQLMANPLAILARLDQSVAVTNGVLVLTQDSGLPNIELSINAETNLPEASRTTEVDFLYGDVVFEIAYSDWKDFNGILFPSGLEYRLNGELIRKEEISNVELNLSETQNLFDVTTQADYNPQEARYGILSSQWYNRMFSFGFSQDLPMNEVNISHVGGNVHLITGSAELAYAVLAVETADGIVVVEPALNQMRSEAVLSAIQNQFPEQAIVGVMATHHHMDHFGGVRTFAAASGNVYIGSDAVPFVEEVLAATHDLLPDALSLSDQHFEVHGISGHTVFGADDQRFEAWPLATPHTEDMLVFYFPSIKALYVGDIYNAGLVYGYDYYPPAMQDNLKERAQLLRNFIEESSLDVETLLTVHGGKTDISELHMLADK